MIDQPTIDKAIAKIIASEGGDKYTNDPDDNGGPTKFGITLKTLREFRGKSSLTAADVKALRYENAAEIYAAKFIHPYEFLNNVTIFNFCVNGGVNHGTGGMNKIIQTALGLTVDGALGPVSTAKLSAAESQDPVQLLADLVAARCEFYTNIVDNKPSQIKYLKGWTNRIAKDLRRL